MQKHKFNIQLFADEQQEGSESSTDSDAISETMLALQKQYEDEHKLRLEAETKITQLSKVIRTMQIQPSKEEKETSLDDAVNKLFN